MVEKFECLGDIVGFSKDGHIRVLKDLYECIPTEFQEDFEQVLEVANRTYYRTYEDNKNKGIKVSTGGLKKEVIRDVITPFLAKFNLECYKPETRVYKPTGSTGLDDKKVVIERKSPLVQVEADSNELHSLFDNFNWDMDVEKKPEELPEEPEPMLKVDDLFDTSDGFSFDDLF